METTDVDGLWPRFPIDSAVVEDLKANEEQHRNVDRFRRTAFICSHGEWNALYWRTSPLYLCALYLMCWFCLLCLCLSWWSSVWVGWGCFFVVVVVYGYDSATCTDWCGRSALYRCRCWLCCVAMGKSSTHSSAFTVLKLSMLCEMLLLAYIIHTCMYLHKTGTLK